MHVPVSVIVFLAVLAVLVLTITFAACKHGVQMEAKADELAAACNKANAEVRRLNYRLNTETRQRNLLEHDLAFIERVLKNTDAFDLISISKTYRTPAVAAVAKYILGVGERFAELGIMHRDELTAKDAKFDATVAHYNQELQNKLAIINSSEVRENHLLSFVEKILDAADEFVGAGAAKGSTYEEQIAGDSVEAVIIDDPDSEQDLTPGSIILIPANAADVLDIGQVYTAAQKQMMDELATAKSNT